MKPYLPTDLPAPIPGVDDAGLFDEWNGESLRFQRCDACGTFRHPPSPCCAAYGSGTFTWQEPPGPAVLFTYTLTHVAPAAQLEDKLPFNVAIIAFPDAGDLRFVSNIVDRDPAPGDIGATVELVWEDGPGGGKLPRFRLEKG